VYLDTLRRLGMTLKCDRQTDLQTDGQTDSTIANAALHYTLRYQLVKVQIHLHSFGQRGLC